MQAEICGVEVAIVVVTTVSPSRSSTSMTWNPAITRGSKREGFFR
jgi:hypothetical protein